MADKIQFRRDTSANWQSINPILAEGELGLITDTYNYKIGNGVDNWLNLNNSSLTSEFQGLTLNKINDPGATENGKMTLYAKEISGRIMPKFVGPSGLDTAIQPFLARNKVGYWCPPGNATTIPGVFGFTSYTASGVATARIINTSNLFTRMRRLGYQGTAAAGQVAGARVAAAQITLGDGSGFGGFHKIIRWGISDPTLVTTARTFVGVSSSTSAGTNIEPSTLLNSIGMGHGATDTNMMIYYGGSVAQPPIDLGVNFPISSNTDVYELALFSPSKLDGVIFYEVTRLNTGDIVSGRLEGTNGIILPSSNTLLTYSQNWRHNNGAGIPAIDIMSDYIETDY